MANLKELSTKAEPDTITIDGVAYELADAGSLSTVEASKLRRRGKTLQAQQGKDDLTDEDAAACDKALDEIFAQIAPGVPAEVAAKLSPGQKAQVIDAFSRRLVEKLAALQAQRQAASSPSSPTSSPPSGDSSASTAAPSANG